MDDTVVTRVSSSSSDFYGKTLQQNIKGGSKEGLNPPPTKKKVCVASCKIHMFSLWFAVEKFKIDTVSKGAP